jgi:hypothetical protein
MSLSRRPREKIDPVAPKRITFDPSLAGLPAAVDGGAEVPGIGGAARETYTGVLTGRRMEYGDPPWLWLEIVVDESPPAESQKVWCDESFVYVSAPDGGGDVPRGN